MLSEDMTEGSCGDQLVFNSVMSADRRTARLEVLALSGSQVTPGCLEPGCSSLLPSSCGATNIVHKVTCALLLLPV